MSEYAHLLGKLRSKTLGVTRSFTSANPRGTSHTEWPRSPTTVVTIACVVTLLDVVTVGRHFHRDYGRSPKGKVT